MRLRYKLALAGGLLIGTASDAQADIWAKAAREAAEVALKKFGKEAASEGAEALTKRIASAAARHGDDAINAVRRVGPKALTLADDAGQQAPQVMRLLARHGDDAAVWVAQRPKAMTLLARYGDDAAEVLVKHKGVAEPIVESLGSPAVRALGAVGPQAGRRIAMMAEGGELAAIGRTPELMEVVARHGDRAMDFIWRNKAALAVGVTLTAFLADPEPFINGTTDLADSVAEHAVKPAFQETARAASSAFNGVLVLLAGVVASLTYLAVKQPRLAAGLGRIAVGRLRPR